MNKPTVLTLRVPLDLKARMADLAAEQGVSLNQFAMYMLTTKVTELETTTFFHKVREGRSPEEIQAEFKAVMEKIKKRPSLAEVPEWDKMPEDG